LELSVFAISCPSVLRCFLAFATVFAVCNLPAQAQSDGEQPDTESSIIEIAPPPASASWRGDIGTLRIGVAAGDDARGTTRRLELFRESLADKLDLPVEIVPFGDFLTMSDAQASGRIEYAVHSALSFAMTSVACNCVEPLAAPTFSGGAKSLRLVVIVQSKAQSDVMAAQATGGAQLGIVGDLAGSEYLEMARAQLDAEGLAPAAFQPGKVRSFEDFQSAAAALAAGDVQGILGWSTLTGSLNDGYSHGTLRSLIETQELTAGDVELVWQSPEFMLGPHAIRRNVPAELKGLLQSHLLALESKEPAAYDSVSSDLAGGFRPVRASDYAPLKDLISSQPNVEDRDQSVSPLIGSETRQ
jgi:phosphonate transport system substrate-binding protein